MAKDTIQIGECTVVLNQQKAQGIWEMELKAPLYLSDVSAFMPGQFVCLVPLDPASVMARPFSISKISVFSGSFTLLYKLVGKNTELMTKLIPGDKVYFWGPLGQGFLPKSSTYDEIWLVGGGIGIAPFVFYNEVMSKLPESIVRVFYGNRTQAEIIPLDLYSKEPVVITTDDGSAGYKGPVTDVVANFMKAAMGDKILVITCGPNIMMSKVAEICQQAGIECYVILETIMACGLNSCKGCTINTESGIKSVCHDGPVFPAKEVHWNELV
ncbi:MAG: hypothetical protein A2Y67_03905 [Candidatus Buchananbacteria bacterium RBG_13_39_9]|uniref:FAD-binding FR-type domain-containing protein n=1 Tax=Candidatus Buchananbacteria bacterium RBG_13_39_9 TaxID=1797531 RepID=A0A1G1XQ09_9BACT|nr:MAG: hypothetical protein A2Y67_03905 [Candidatus Buchananbacteria bacterium RBG_13_39_9]